ncbi:histidine kinase [Paenibacillus oryzae]|uniref:Histidine kinase n=1 Tax=Paenibacillus oryzae TaxID=1844972 RepID=A0A1A5YQV6_9BACL|nr:ANTAR domain-containing protein [Paenibacillus oryzae]OBR67958.1 histidine kinase [Paenibacillus oryzae]
MRSLLIVEPDVAAVRRADLSPSISLPKKKTPVYVLEEYGYAVLAARDIGKAETLIGSADALILHMPLNDVKPVGHRLTRAKALPLFWWCSAASAADSLQYCEEDAPVDGLLTASMSEQELHWSLHFGERQFMERQQWLSEKKQLEGRLEERKWIDMAKGILCQIKNISEAEAYEVLRKQAMNDRKRMVDVATSIVRVHQLLQDQK